MNRVVLMGRLTRDPDVRYTQGENSMAVARYTLAVDRRRSRTNVQDGQQTADFISCVAFGRPAEFAEKYLRKGVKICISGRIQTGSYTNKDGVRIYTTDVVVEDQEFAESKNAQGGGSDYSSMRSAAPASQSGSSQGSSADQGQGKEQPSGAIDGFMNIPDGIDEELPFT